MMTLPEQHRSRLLHRALIWLTGLRWIAGCAILAAGLLDSTYLHWFGTGSQGTVALGIAILAFNAIVRTLLAKVHSHKDGDTRLLTLASAEIYFDLACLTRIAIWSGGLYSPAMGLFFLHMIFASLLQPRNRALAAAAFAIISLWMALFLAGMAPSTRQDWMVGISWSLTIVAMVLLIESVTRALYRRELSRIRQVLRLKEMSRQLHHQQKALIQSEKMVAVGQLASGIAHEINNPLSNMDSVLQLMQRKPDVPRPDAINSLREQIQRIHRIIRQLTSFAHPGEGVFEILELNDVVRSSIQMIAMDKRLRGTTLECHLAPDTGTARLNRHALEQVLANLVVNAIDATGGLPEPRVAVVTRREGDSCVLEIADNGAGIDPKDLNRIYEPFFTTKPIGQGTGLGLWITSRLVRDHGATIEALSAPAKGTRFILRFPIMPSAPESAAADATQTPPAA
ncbi:MAG: ATP-binding protein [Planctomycetota bacterium]|nr:ATP-binding protein [Planctomycetota bacterium]